MSGATRNFDLCLAELQSAEVMRALPAVNTTEMPVTTTLATVVNDDSVIDPHLTVVAHQNGILKASRFWRMYSTMHCQVSDAQAKTTKRPRRHTV